MSVSIRYLDRQYLKRYKRIANSVESRYAEVVTSVKTHLPYSLNVYVTPFVIEDTEKLGPRTTFRAYFNLNFYEPDDLSHRAIFTTLEFLEKFPQYIPAGFGHELAHQIAEGDRKMTKRDLELQLRNPLQAKEEQETRKNKALDLFPKQLQGLIHEWDMLSSEKSTAQMLLKNAWKVPMIKFEKRVYGSKLPQLQEIILANTKQALSSVDTYEEELQNQKS